MAMTKWLPLCGLLLAVGCDVPCPTRRGDDPSCNLAKPLMGVTPTRLPRTGGQIEIAHEDIQSTKKISVRLVQDNINAPLVLVPGNVTIGKVSATVTAMDLLRFSTGPARVVLGVNDREISAQIYIYNPPVFAKDPTLKQVVEPMLDSITSLQVIDRQLLTFRKQSDGAGGFKGVLWTYPLATSYELAAGKAWGSLNWDGVAQIKKLGSLFVGTAVNADDRLVRLCDTARETCDDSRVITSPIKSTLLLAWSTGDARSGLVLTVNTAGGTTPFQGFTVSNGKFVDTIATAAGAPALSTITAATLTDLGSGPVALLASNNAIAAFTYQDAGKQLTYDSAISMRLNTALVNYLAINSFAVGDLDQDKLPDAAVTISGRPTSVDLLSNRGDGVLAPANLSSALNMANVTASEIGDINGDGVNDLILAGSDKSIAIFRNSAK